MAIDWTINRRGLFYGGAAALVGGVFGLSERVARADSQFPPLTLISAARIEGVDGGALLCEEGLCQFALSARAHALTRLPNSHSVILVGRRPGKFAAIVDAEAPQESARLFTPLANHRFAGHAAVGANTLVTSEMDEETAEGSIVLRDTGSAAPKERFPAGIEPHDILFARGGETLVVAIGGIAHAAEVKGPAINAGNIDSHILELDPLSPVSYADLVRAFHFARRYEEAVEANRKAREMDPHFAIAHIVAGAAYEQKGMYEEAIAELRQANNLPGGSAEALAALGHAFAASGRRDEALRTLKELERMSEGRYVSPLDLAILYAGLDDKERTLEQLERATEDRVGWLINLGVEPRFDTFRSEPRYVELLRRIGLAT